MSYSPAKIETPHEEPEAKPLPTWFSEDSSKALAQSYIAQRAAREKLNYLQAAEELSLQQRRLEERFESARQLYDRPAPSVQQGTVPLPRMRRPMMAEAAFPTPPNGPKARIEARPKTHYGAYIVMAFVAVAVGGGAGFGYTNRDSLLQFVKGKADQVAVTLPNFKAWSEAPPAVPKKEVSMASLDVNDARGALNSMIPLMLHASPGDIAQPIDIKISGLPSSAYLSAGKRSGAADWTLTTKEIEGLKLVVPQTDLAMLDLEVAALDQKSGALAAPVKSLSIALDQMPKAVAPETVITPASAPAEGAVTNFNLPPVPTPSVDPKAPDYLAKGDALMKAGDIAMARQFYMKANELGNAKGAFGVARSYDPKVFAQLNVQGLQPDAAKAAEWYKKAADAGVTNTP